MHPHRSASLFRRGATIVAVAAVLAALAGCAAGPSPEPTSTGDPTPEITTLGETPGASASPSSTPEPVADIAIPVRCEDIYSPAMLSILESGNPPLNDPGVTMDSSEVPALLDTLASGAQTIRCSWGLPSSYGLATNVTIVDDSQAEAVLAALESSGFACADLAGGTVCRVQ